ncbi:hypothetical protein DB346_05465 [Verrucomicrobia bacterium LW23]|nr:hypothetical protein DB346_05465 [Verrucomicrobia bacterium LW23]
MPADAAEKILAADFKNIVRKVQEGKPLTVAERACVESRAAGSTDSTAFAKNLVELAAILGVTRRTLCSWQKLPGAPRPQSNGTWSMAEWREFVRTRGLKARVTSAGNEEALKARKLLAEVEERELKVAIRKGEYVPLAEVRAAWMRAIGKATEQLRARFENELPPILSGLDAVGIQSECRRAIDGVLAVLHGGDGAAKEISD